MKEPESLTSNPLENLPEDQKGREALTARIRKEIEHQRQAIRELQEETEKSGDREIHHLQQEIRSRQKRLGVLENSERKLQAMPEPPEPKIPPPEPPRELEEAPEDLILTLKAQDPDLAEMLKIFEDRERMRGYLDMRLKDSREKRTAMEEEIRADRTQTETKIPGEQAKLDPALEAIRAKKQELIAAIDKRKLEIDEELHGIKKKLREMPDAKKKVEADLRILEAREEKAERKTEKQKELLRAIRDLKKEPNYGKTREEIVAEIALMQERRTDRRKRGSESKDPEEQKKLDQEQRALTRAIADRQEPMKQPGFLKSRFEHLEDELEEADKEHDAAVEQLKKSQKKAHTDLKAELERLNREEHALQRKNQKLKRLRGQLEDAKTGLSSIPEGRFMRKMNDWQEELGEAKKGQRSPRDISRLYRKINQKITVEEPIFSTALQELFDRVHEADQELAREGDSPFAEELRALDRVIHDIEHADEADHIDPRWSGALRAYVRDCQELERLELKRRAEGREPVDLNKEKGKPFWRKIFLEKLIHRAQIFVADREKASHTERGRLEAREKSAYRSNLAILSRIDPSIVRFYELKTLAEQAKFEQNDSTALRAEMEEIRKARRTRGLSDLKPHDDLTDEDTVRRILEDHIDWIHRREDGIATVERELPLLQRQAERNAADLAAWKTQRKAVVDQLNEKARQCDELDTAYERKTEEYKHAKAKLESINARETSLEAEKEQLQPFLNSEKKYEVEALIARIDAELESLREPLTQITGALLRIIPELEELDRARKRANKDLLGPAEAALRESDRDLQRKLNLGSGVVITAPEIVPLTSVLCSFSQANAEVTERLTGEVAAVGQVVRNLMDKIREQEAELLRLRQRNAELEARREETPEVGTAVPRHPLHRGLEIMRRAAKQAQAELKKKS